MSLPEPIPPTSSERLANRIIRSSTTIHPQPIKDGMECLDKSQREYIKTFITHKVALLNHTKQLAKSRSIGDKLRHIDSLNRISEEMEKAGREELINLEVGNKVHRMKVYRFPN